MSTALPDRMRALILKEDGYSSKHSGTTLEAMAPYVEMAEVPLPAVGDGQLLVRMRMAAVNPSDVMFIKGLYGQPRHKGAPAGFEGVGEVVAAGPDGAGRNLIGKRIAFAAAGARGNGTWAEYAVAQAAAAIPLSDAVRDEDGAALIVNPLTALAMFDIVREAGHKAFVLTAGASQLCKLMIGIAAEEGFRPIAIVRRDEQIAQLKELGAAHALNADSPSFTAELVHVLKDEQPRIFLDAVTGKLAGTIFYAMGRDARWIVYGRLDAGDTPIVEPGQMIFMNKRIEGFWLTRWMREVPADRRVRAVMEAQQRFADGRWKTDVTAVVPLADAMDRLPQELGKPNGKVFIAP